jgi:hypothetical protein
MRSSRCGVAALALVCGVGWSAAALAEAAVVGNDDGALLAEAESSETPPLPGPGARTLGLFASVGYVGSPSANGVAADEGIRWGLSRHLALSFDFGYGNMGASGKVQDPTHNVEDRWWLMPAVAWVIPTSRMLLDFGAGVGFATASGYPSWSFFGAHPFGPVWAFQLAPAVRLHAVASTRVSRRIDLFALLQVGSLLLGGNSIGIRSANVDTSLMDTTWLNLSFGVRYRLF